MMISLARPIIVTNADVFSHRRLALNILFLEVVPLSGMTVHRSTKTMFQSRIGLFEEELFLQKCARNSQTPNHKKPNTPLTCWTLGMYAHTHTGSLILCPCSSLSSTERRVLLAVPPTHLTELQADEIRLILLPLFL